MKVLSSWLNAITEQKLNAKQQAERLEQAGLELEQIISSSKFDDKIVVGRITKVTQHSNADKLRLADVTDGKSTYRIVCGAPNIAEGQLVPMAKIGTILPDGNVIERATIRGEQSNGMLCSAKELGINDDHEGILILDDSTPVGTTLCDIWDTGDVLDLTSAYNRPDLLSAIGIARELAAFSDKRLGESVYPGVKGKVDKKLVGTLDKNVVKRYLLTHVKLGKTGETPEWMKQRLLASGVRPIGTVVDITNYVLIEVGQPLHAFDARSVQLPVSVRLPRQGEKKIVTLDGNERSLSKNDAIIADGRSPLALAGVMGGLSSEVIPETTEILLEAATFEGAITRASAVRHGIRTEASARFERGLPAELAGIGMARAVELLKDLCDGEVLAISEDNWRPQKPTVITLSPEKIGAIYGAPVKASESKKLLERLGFSVQMGKQMVVIVPWWRTDVKLAEDIVEEVTRSLGYDDLPASLPAWEPNIVHFDKRHSRIWQLKAAMRGLGLDEVATYSFVSHDQLTEFGQSHNLHLKLKNPMSLEQAYLRSSLAPSLLNVVSRNARQVDDIGIFEVSKVFVAQSDKGQLPIEPLRLGVAVYEKNVYARVKAALDLLEREFKLGLKVVPKANEMFATGLCAEIKRGGKSLGWIGQLSPTLSRRYKLREMVGFLELDVSSWIEEAIDFLYQPISRFPSIVRDLSLVLDQSVTWAEVKSAISADSLQSVEFLNDYYGKELGEGKKALAVRLIFGSQERTLTEDLVDKAADKVAKHLMHKFGAKLR